MRLANFTRAMPFVTICATWAISLTTFAAARSPIGDQHHAQLIARLLNGQADDSQLLDAALVAGGAESRADFARYRYAIDRCVARAQARILASNTDQLSPSIQQVVGAMLAAIHDTLLRGGFDDRCHNLCQTLEQGRFNCVTASTVFQIVARRLGVAAQIELLPNHVRCRVSDDATQLIVETTSKNGVQATTVPIEGRLLTDAQLLAKLYYNRALDLLADRQFGLALQHAELAWRLDPVHREAQENMAIVACRWAVALTDERRWPVALSLLRRAAMTTDQHAFIDATEVLVFASWIQSAAAKGNDRELQRRVREQLLLAIARRPTSQPLLQLVQRLPVN